MRMNEDIESNANNAHLSLPVVGRRQKTKETFLNLLTYVYLAEAFDDSFSRAHL